MNTTLIWDADLDPFEPILVENKDIHVFRARGINKFDLLLLKKIVKPCIFHMSDSIKSNLCWLKLDVAYFDRSLFEEDGFYCEFVEILSFSDVINLELVSRQNDTLPND